MLKRPLLSESLTFRSWLSRNTAGADIVVSNDGIVVLAKIMGFIRNEFDYLSWAWSIAFMHIVVT